MSDEVGYTSGERITVSAALRSGAATPIIITGFTLEGTALAGTVKVYDGTSAAGRLVKSYATPADPGWRHSPEVRWHLLQGCYVEVSNAVAVVDYS